MKRNYNFTVISTYDPNVRLNISTAFEIDSSLDYTTIIKGEPLFNLLPLNYKIEVTNIDGVQQPIVWITGTRCRWKCNRKTHSCEDQKCWSNPSLCLGDIDSCTKYDADGSCLKISEIVDENEEDQNTFTFTNMDLEKYIYQYFEKSQTSSYISDFGEVNFSTPTFFAWMCDSTEIQGDHHLICYTRILPVLSSPSYQLLKTIAG